MNNITQQAIHAAHLRVMYGRYAALKFVQKHNIPMRLYVQASQLLAAQKGGF